MTLRAHYLTPHDANGLRLRRAHPQRAWMQDTPGAGGSTGYASRCLPLLIANQLGWDVVSRRTYVFVPLENGHFLIHPLDGTLPTAGAPQNNFGGGLVTWPSPWSFETPPGWDLLVLPPVNHLARPGVTALGALVETDHGITRFTFNWKVELGTAVFVRPDDVIATLVPYPTDQLAGWALEETGGEPEGFGEWAAVRKQDSMEMAADAKTWPKRYWDAAKRRKL